MDRLRTPEHCFNNLPNFSYAVHFAPVTDPTGGDPLRMAYLDEGPQDAFETIVLLHGEPTWSFLYRHMIPALSAAGHRVIVPDLIGFGRSDKPTPRAEYSYAREVEWVRELLFDVLGLNDVTFFGQDWGSLIGLRLVGENEERFARVAIGNGGLPTGEGKVSEAFESWQKFSQEAPELPIGRIVGGGCTTKISDDIVAGYDAPFPDESYKEGARALPTLVPTQPSDPAHDAQLRSWVTLGEWTKPFITLYSDGDPITKGAEKVFQAKVPGATGQQHTTIEGGGHFLQEDRGPQLADALLLFMKANPR